MAAYVKNPSYPDTDQDYTAKGALRREFSGKLCPQTGVKSGSYDQEQKNKLYRGYTMSDEKLNQRVGVERTDGKNYRGAVEYVNTAMKHTSMLLAAAAPEMRQQIADGLWRCNQENKEFVEQNFTQTQSGKTVEQAMQFSSYEHDDARPTISGKPGDMNWHAHNWVHNACRSAEGKWVALDYSFMLGKGADNKMKAIKQDFRDREARMMRDIGFQVIKQRNGSYSIMGIDESATAHFCKRSQLIAKIKSGYERMNPKLDHAIGNSTKKRKFKTTKADVYSFWKSELAGFGINAEKVKALSQRSTLIARPSSDAKTVRTDYNPSREPESWLTNSSSLSCLNTFAAAMSQPLTPQPQAPAPFVPKANMAAMMVCADYGDNEVAAHAALVAATNAAANAPWEQKLKAFSRVQIAMAALTRAREAKQMRELQRFKQSLPKPRGMNG